jgi:hypothetical protein
MPQGTASLKKQQAATNEPAITRHLLSASALIKIPRVQFRRHLEKP